MKVIWSFPLFCSSNKEATNDLIVVSQRGSPLYKKIVCSVVHIKYAVSIFITRANKRLRQQS